MTDNVQRRLHEHMAGKGGRYTKLFKVERLLYTENFLTAREAQQRESQLKRWSWSKKRALIEGDLKLLKEL